MKKILVAQPKSFIGSNFIELYKKKYDIVAPKEGEVDFAECSSAVRYLRESGVDAVLCANYVDPLAYFEFSSMSVIEFKNIQYAATLAGVKKMIVASDASDIEASEPHANVTEEEAEELVPALGAGLEKHIIHTLAEKDRISTVLRFFGLYGKGSDIYSNSQTELLSHAISGKKQIALAGDKVFSDLYIEDACKLIALFLDNDYPQGIYNAASTETASFSLLAKKAKSFAKKNGREIEVFAGEESEPEFTADVSKLMGAIGQFKFTAHSAGIGKTLEWFAAHKQKLKG